MEAGFMKEQAQFQRARSKMGEATSIATNINAKMFENKEKLMHSLSTVRMLQFVLRQDQSHRRGLDFERLSPGQFAEATEQAKDNILPCGLLRDWRHAVGHV